MAAGTPAVAVDECVMVTAPPVLLPVNRPAHRPAPGPSPEPIALALPVEADVVEVKVEEKEVVVIGLGSALEVFGCCGTL